MPNFLPDFPFIFLSFICIIWSLWVCWLDVTVKRLLWPIVWVSWWQLDPNVGLGFCIFQALHLPWLDLTVKRITRSRSDYVSWVMSLGHRVPRVGQIRQHLLSNRNQTMFWKLSSRNLWHHPSDQTRPSVTRVTKPDQASPEWPNQTKRLPSDQTRPSVTRVTKPDQASPKWPNQTKCHPSDQTR